MGRRLNPWLITLVAILWGCQPKESPEQVALDYLFTEYWSQPWGEGATLHGVGPEKADRHHRALRKGHSALPQGIMDRVLEKMDTTVSLEGMVSEDFPVVLQEGMPLYSSGKWLLRVYPAIQYDDHWWVHVDVEQVHLGYYHYLLQLNDRASEVVEVYRK